MARPHLETTGHILHNISCCRKVARDIRAKSVDELLADNAQLERFEDQIIDHFNFEFKTIIRFKVRSAYCDDIEAQRPTARASILASQGYAKLTRMAIMTELTYNEDTIPVDGKLPDLYLELEAMAITSPSTDSEPIKLWVPVQHLEEAEFLHIEEYGRN